MRLSIALVLAVGIAVAVVVARNGHDDPSTTPPGAVTLVGDSLNVGIEPYLADALPGWRIDSHDLVGRQTAEGVDELRAIRVSLAPVVVVSLGTNDADGTEARFRALVDDALRIAGPRRCVVWATIVRDGAERTGFDDVLRDAAAGHANLHLVDWAATVANDDSLLAPDQVHGTPEGYERRAKETARAVRRCG